MGRERIQHNIVLQCWMDIHYVCMYMNKVCGAWVGVMKLQITKI